MAPGAAEVRMDGPDDFDGDPREEAARRAARQPRTVGGQVRRDAELNRHGRQSADDAGVQDEGEGAAELDAEIARRESGGTPDRPRTGVGVGVGPTRRPPD
jgi:hypothetical protein